MAKYNLALHLQHIDADDVPTKEELQQYADEFVKNFTSYDPNCAGWDWARVRVSARKAHGFNPLKDGLIEVTATAECKKNEWHTSKDYNGSKKIKDDAQGSQAD